MSADEIKQRFSDVRLRGSKHAQLEELVRLQKWKDAQTLRDEIEGRQREHGHIVRIDFAAAHR